MFKYLGTQAQLKKFEFVENEDKTAFCLEMQGSTWYVIKKTKQFYLGIHDCSTRECQESAFRIICEFYKNNLIKWVKE